MFVLSLAVLVVPDAAGATTQACAGTLTIEVHEDDPDGPLVGGGRADVDFESGDDIDDRELDEDGVTELGEFACQDVSATLEVPPGDHVAPGDGDRATGTIDGDGEALVFVVTRVHGAPPPPPPCEGEVTVFVHEGSSDGPLIGGGSATVGPRQVPLDHDTDGTQAGRFPCGDIAGTLDAAPDGYTVEDGNEATTVSEDGGELHFVVFAVVHATAPAVPPEESEGPPGTSCAGSVTVRVVDPDGQPVSGALIRVASLSVIMDTGTHTHSRMACGEQTVALVSTPDGYSTSGSRSRSVTVTAEHPAEVVFALDTEVLGVVVEQTPGDGELPLAGSDVPLWLTGIAALLLVSASCALVLARDRFS
ncbi:MAG: hypothetical protein KY437_10605 [Actinobacteria bacterium]|nr:hypothetical protein [Actinomycetota bacterium]